HPAHRPAGDDLELVRSLQLLAIDLLGHSTASCGTRFSRGTPPRSQSACKVRAVRLLVALLFALPAGAAPVRAGTPHLQLRLEGLFGQPTTRLGARGGLGLGVGWRMTDQLWIIGDAAQ